MSLIEINNLKVHYPIRSGFFNRVTDSVKAVDGISFNIEKGQTYGLVGESKGLLDLLCPTQIG
ncbi:hypothetical protein ATX44_11270 [Oenococcus oeni]|nr:hypothetical protein ATX44_11270 [Oenococcus oeni]